MYKSGQVAASKALTLTLKDTEKYRRRITYLDYL